MARISVIIPTHNRASMLQRAIESAKNAGDGVEVVVVDDASTDDTELICRGLTDITYLRMPRNRGQARARNAGIARSTGEYIAFLDDDDLRLPQSLDRQADMLARDQNLGFVYGQVQIANSETGLLTGRIWPLDCPTGDIFWQLVEGNFIQIASVLVRRRQIEAIGLFSSDVLGTEDWDVWLRLAAISPVGAVQEPVAVYRRASQKSGQTSSNRPKMWKSSARTQARALRSPRALTANGDTRREVRSKFMDGLWDGLIEDGDRLVSERNLYSAAINYITAIRLHPRRAARLGAITNFTRFIHSQSR